MSSWMRSPLEEQAARRYLECLRDASDPFAHLDRTDPFADVSGGERAKLQEALARAEKEIAAREVVSADDVFRNLRTTR